MKIMIAGASGGIGRILTEHFDRPENTLYLTYNNHPERIYAPVNCDLWMQFMCNFSDSLEVETTFNFIPELDAIINCLGHVDNSLITGMDPDQWDQVIDSNLKAVFLSCKYGLPKVSCGGHIINISSVLGAMGMPGASNYCAAKGAVEAFTRSFAQECLIKRRVYVNAIALGYFKCGMGLVLTPEITEMIRARIPLKEFGEPREIALVVDYVLASRYLSGSTLQVNGGLWNS